MTPIRVGTRGSALATTQSQHIADRLAAAGAPAELKVVTTTGDVTSGSLAQLGGTGVFAAALRQELLGGSVDVAVHSLKDLPTKDLFDGALALIYPSREDPRDVLVARDGLDLDGLPAGSRIGTGSPRRAAQLRILRPDCQVVDIRGNVGTRLSRVAGLERFAADDTGVGRGTHGDLDAVVLAAAGLARLGLSEVVTEFLDPRRVLPAAGQGCLAIEYRSGSTPAGVLAAIRALQDGPTELAVQAERALLLRLEAGCAAPIGAFARLEEGTLTLDAVVADPRGGEVLRESATAPAAGPEESRALGTRVAESLLERGADRYTDRTS
jgi:hydroxymethylbilane synthase